MSRPQITVEVTAALPRRGTDSATGTAFVVFAGATGPTTPTVCLSQAAATTAGVPDAVAAWVGDALTQGAPRVVALRATAVDAEAVTQAEWTTALNKLTADHGVGQVLIPGVATPAAYAAMLDHADRFGRTVLLDAASAAASAGLVTAATGLAAAAGAERAALLAGWVEVPAGGTTRQIPGSVAVAGLAARGDSTVGHTNHAPAGTQSRSAGVVAGGTGVTVTYTDTELDSLHDAGVSAIRMVDGTPTLFGWVSLSDDDRFRQLNVGRTAMMLGDQIGRLARDFLFRPIDAQGHLYAELDGALRGYLQPLWGAGALYGATAEDAYDVEVGALNTPATAAAGQLHAAIEVALTPHTERITISIVTRTPEGA